MFFIVQTIVIWNEIKSINQPINQYIYIYIYIYIYNLWILTQAYITICPLHLLFFKYFVHDICTGFLLLTYYFALDNYCYSDPCLNGGTCLLEANGYQCECPPVFLGDYCEIGEYWALGSGCWAFWCAPVIQLTMKVAHWFRQVRAGSKLSHVFRMVTFKRSVPRRT